MALDIRTLMVMLALAGLLTSGALLIVRRLHLGIPGVTWWAWANATCAAGLVMGAFRGVWPAFLSIVMNNVLLSGATTMSLTGCLLFAGRPGLKWLTPAGMAAMAACLSWFTFVDPSVVARIEIMFLASTLMCAWSGWALIDGSQTLARRITGLVYVLFAVFSVLRVALVAGTEIADLMRSGIMTEISFLGAFVFVLAATLGQIIMTTERLHADLRRQANRDWLTGVFNRRAFRLLAQKELARVQRSGGVAGLMVMDLDHFKQINDRFGHAAGDDMLRAFVAAAQANLREQDVFCRHGGEEFVALLPDTDLGGTLAVAERLRAAFAAVRVETEGRVVGTTVSIGVAEGRGAEAELETLLRQADMALYRAKAAGRDRSVAAGPAPAVAPKPAGL